MNMEKKHSRVPDIGESFWFYPNDIIKESAKLKAKVIGVYNFANSDQKFIYKYVDEVEEVIAVPLMDLWIDAVEENFWILAQFTDYILELQIPGLTPLCVFAARDLDGGWHAFETVVPTQFGFLDVDGIYDKAMSDDTGKTTK